ncbi:hypothetical protein HIM_01645 [Hirsutella minnesotensis 3608]|nr:hypothetical protein HIM_01645 [Hirsutella minnesotensis 3608]
MPATEDTNFAPMALRAKMEADLRRHDQAVKRLGPLEQRLVRCRNASKVNSAGQPSVTEPDGHLLQEELVNPVPPPAPIHPPHAKFLIDTKYPVEKITRRAPVRSGNRPAPRQLSIKSPVNSEPEFAVIHGVQTRKRRAESSEIDLVAGLHNVADTNPFAPRRMFESPFLRRVTGMMSNVYSTVTTIGGSLTRFFQNTSYTVTELRSYVRVPHHAGLHVSNKRCKLSPAEESSAKEEVPSWLPEQAPLIKLLNGCSAFMSYLDLLRVSVETHGQRQDINRCLSALKPALIATDDEKDRYEAGELDLRDSFLTNLKICLSYLPYFYNIDYFCAYKRELGTPPAEVQYPERMIALWKEEDWQRFARIPAFFSGAALPVLCDNILKVTGATPQLTFPLDFANQILLDVRAILNSFPIPSFVVSKEFHDRMESLFPRPKRTDLDQRLLLPGAFPFFDEDDAPVQAVQQEPEQPCPPPTQEAPSVSAPAQSQPKPRPQPPSPPNVARKGTGKTAQLAAHFLESHISELNPQQFRRDFYVDSQEHCAIESKYITEFEQRAPSTDAAPLRPILKNRRMRNGRLLPSQRIPPRLAMTRAQSPRVVRFTESTMNPRPRTHLGLDVPRLMQRDEERYNEQFAQVRPSFESHEVATPAEDLSATQRGSVGEESVPTFAINYRASRPQPEDTKHHSIYGPDHQERLRQGLIKSTLKRDRPSEAERAAIDDRIREIFEEPSPPGLAPISPSKILASLIEKKRIDTSYRDAERARIAKEQAKKEAEEAAIRQKEEAQRREQEEARRREEEEVRRREEETRRREEEARRVEEEARKRAAEDRARREEEAFAAQTTGLRRPRTTFIAPVSPHWERRARETLAKGAATVQAKTGEGADLRRHDFASVVPSTTWLNDEIVNGSLVWIDRAVNEAAGIKDVKRQTRKCFVMNSFFFKDLLSKGPLGTERRLRRNGVTKENFLNVETIVLPICEYSHWTVLVIRPTRRTVTHIDSLNPAGTQQYVDLGLAWVKDVLKEKFVQNEWKVVQTEAPAQTNGYDCGVFTITNAMCMALGLSPIHSYSAKDMPLQRIRITCALLNGGFTGDFDLTVY